VSRRDGGVDSKMNVTLNNHKYKVNSETEKNHTTQNLEYFQLSNFNGLADKAI